MTNRTIETKIDIKAPAKRVWEILTRFEDFPQWSRFILSIEGQARPGSRLSVHLNDGGQAMRLRPTVEASEEGVELRWRGTVGSSFLFTGEHRFHLDPQEDGTTRFTHSETFGGILVPLLWKKLNSRTRQAFNEFNAALCRQSEGVAG
jgi:hypothetical protein